MKLRRTFGSAAGVALGVTLAVYPAAFQLHAGTLGKLSGVVLDAKNQPLAGANVIVVGIPFGAATDMEGRYAIFNVPVGTYSVKLSLIGYASTTVQSVAISADHTTDLDVTLRE